MMVFRPDSITLPRGYKYRRETKIILVVEKEEVCAVICHFTFILIAIGINIIDALQVKYNAHLFFMSSFIVLGWPRLVSSWWHAEPSRAQTKMWNFRGSAMYKFLAVQSTAKPSAITIPIREAEECRT